MIRPYAHTYGPKRKPKTWRNMCVVPHPPRLGTVRLPCPWAPLRTYPVLRVNLCTLSSGSFWDIRWKSNGPDFGHKGLYYFVEITLYFIKINPHSTSHTHINKPACLILYQTPKGQYILNQMSNFRSILTFIFVLTKFLKQDQCSIYFWKIYIWLFEKYIFWPFETWLGRNICMWDPCVGER